METLGDFKVMFREDGGADADRRGCPGDRPAVALLRHRLTALYETSGTDLPEAFQDVLAEMSRRLDEA